MGQAAPGGQTIKSQDSAGRFHLQGDLLLERSIV
jgi:hypothetical protein